MTTAEPRAAGGATGPGGDISDRAAVARLVDAFYRRVRTDDILGPIFDDVARVDWAQHLPRMYDFWESVLFGTVRFKGNPLDVHRELAQRAPMTSTAFDRWLELFHASVDALFAGPFAEEAKVRALRIATAFQHHIAADRGPQADTQNQVRSPTARRVTATSCAADRARSAVPKNVRDQTTPT